MGAMDEEVRLIRSDLVGARVVPGPCEMIAGRLEGRPVILARSGIGKVNAALAAAAMVSAGASSIVFTGVAGAVTEGLGIGDVVIGDRFVQHDADGTAFGDPIGQVPGEPRFWRPDEVLSDRVHAAALALTGPGIGHAVVRGTIASGDQFIADPARVQWLRRTFDAAAVEMEGAALAQAASHLGVPFAVVRILSDSADGDAVQDFPAFLAEAAERDRQLARMLVAG
ncbi:5'-methylthioadenosine/adenosylhomocysteine nucleosidase [Acidipropionibacterium jensenii]|uniref:5'-methylthioadenosine/adenosylhomocysteine nucleosidase n=1 Tax=Acidipropionibacterium jensenii TaxID=1749 RepID=UPI00110BBDB4|nr:5'-methylthioadenosine/adenosylhomocysteine nucleosidase [Acidipropionibacterium jensenii]QCV89437.1 5'-methylthioadenosine/adenosylhomocysteine nucleosidase [Acidipropionibacterium jensenii]